MNPAQFVLFPTDLGWRVAVAGDLISFEDAESPADIAAMMTRHGGEQRAWIALPSNECLCATVSTVGLPRGSADEALRYRLEEILPWAAEDFVVATSGATDGQAFAVATKRRELDARIDTLSSVGISIAGVSPAALLAAAAAGDDAHTILLEDDQPHWLNLIQFRNRSPIAWNLISDDPEQLRIRLDEIAAAHVKPTESMATLAATEAARILTRRSQPQFNFLGGKPARSRAGLSAVACAAILLGLCLGFVWRTVNYNRAATQSDVAAHAIFARVFPGSPVPAGVVSRLVGQARSIRAAAGVVGDVPQQSKTISPTLATLLNSLGSLPPTVRFAVDDLTLDEHHLSITGQAASLGDAQIIADAMRSLSGWTVDPPRTEQRLAAVNFTIQASPDLSSHAALAAGELP